MLTIVLAARYEMPRSWQWKYRYQLLLYQTHQAEVGLKANVDRTSRDQPAHPHTLLGNLNYQLRQYNVILLISRQCCDCSD